MPCCYYTGINEKGVQAELMESLEDEPETIIRLRDVGCDNIATDKNAFAGAGSHLKTYVKHVSTFWLVFELSGTNRSVMCLCTLVQVVNIWFYSTTKRKTFVVKTCYYVALIKIRSTRQCALK